MKSNTRNRPTPYNFVFVTTFSINQTTTTTTTIYWVFSSHSAQCSVVHNIEKQKKNHTYMRTARRQRIIDHNPPIRIYNRILNLKEFIYFTYLQTKNYDFSCQCVYECYECFLIKVLRLACLCRMLNRTRISFLRWIDYNYIHSDNLYLVWKTWPNTDNNREFKQTIHYRQLTKCPEWKLLSKLSMELCAIQSTC